MRNLMLSLVRVRIRVGRGSAELWSKHRVLTMSLRASGVSGG